MDMERRKRRCPVKNKRSKAGETLTETLVAMLIIGLSSVLFLTMVATSARIYQRSKDRYDDIYGKITEAELQGSPLNDSSGNAVTGEITVAGSDPITVKWYGDPDYVLSYKVG